MKKIYYNAEMKPNFIRIFQNYSSSLSKNSTNMNKCLNELYINSQAIDDLNLSYFNKLNI